MALTRILISVKTYPTLSATYDELVCTAGFKEDGSWIRVYPWNYTKVSHGRAQSIYYNRRFLSPQGR